jgi:carboxyl-terminal processing protease
MNKLPRKRGKFTQPLLGLLLIALLVLGAFRATEAGPPQKSYPALDLFTEVFAKVQNLYVKEVDPKQLVYYAIDGMLQNLDSHSSFMTPEMMSEMRLQISGKYGGLGMQIGKVPNGPIRIEGIFEDTPAARAGLQVKDLILKIDGQDTTPMNTQQAANLMRGEPKTTVKILVQREGWQAPKEFTLTREIITLKSIRKVEVIDNAYGYIHLASFQDTTTSELEEALSKIEKNPGIRGLILDLRNNPGGPLKQAIDVADLFLASGVIVSIRGRPGQNQENREFTAHASGTHPDYPMIVLVNEGTASASEIVAGALQDHGRAVILGTKTFGKGSVQTILELRDGSGLRLTTALYYTPNGRSIQATGIEPDIVVENKPRYVSPTGKTPRIIREQDLPHHFENPHTAPGGQPQTAPGTITPEEEPQEEPEQWIENEAEDIQLQRAIELLKSWAIFQGVQQRRSASAR